MPDIQKRWWSDIPVGPRWAVLVFAALVVLGMLQAGGHIPCPLWGSRACEYADHDK